MDWRQGRPVSRASREGLGRPLPSALSGSPFRRGPFNVGSPGKRSLDPLPRPSRPVPRHSPALQRVRPGTSDPRRADVASPAPRSGRLATPAGPAAGARGAGTRCPTKCPARPADGHPDPGPPARRWRRAHRPRGPWRRLRAGGLSVGAASALHGTGLSDSRGGSQRGGGGGPARVTALPGGGGGDRPEANQLARCCPKPAGEAKDAPARPLAIGTERAGPRDRGGADWRLFPKWASRDPGRQLRAEEAASCWAQPGCPRGRPHGEWGRGASAREEKLGKGPHLGRRGPETVPRSPPRPAARRWKGGKRTGAGLDRNPKGHGGAG